MFLTTVLVVAGDWRNLYVRCERREERKLEATRQMLRKEQFVQKLSKERNQIKVSGCYYLVLCMTCMSHTVVASGLARRSQSSPGYALLVVVDILVSRFCYLSSLPVSCASFLQCASLGGRTGVCFVLGLW